LSRCQIFIFTRRVNQLVFWPNNLIAHTSVVNSDGIGTYTNWKSFRTNIYLLYVYWVLDWLVYLAILLCNLFKGLLNRFVQEVFNWGSFSKCFLQAHQINFRGYISMSIVFFGVLNVFGTIIFTFFYSHVLPSLLKWFIWIILWRLCLILLFLFFFVFILLFYLWLRLNGFLSGLTLLIRTTSANSLRRNLSF